MSFGYRARRHIDLLDGFYIEIKRSVGKMVIFKLDIFSVV